MTFTATATVVNNYPRTNSPTPSVSSSTSTSSSYSVTSNCSVATSVTSLASDTSAPPTTVLPQLSEHALQRHAATSTKVKDGVRQPPIALTIQPPQPQEVLPAEQRQNSRRTKCTSTDAAPPVPSLQRQADRKVNFVENLVDSAAAIVETIWTPPKHLANADPSVASTILPLRVFIQETLRRSRTSYSTLQVALYYLIVIRPHIPSPDCSIEHMDREEAQLVRAMQCGRRMFLAALILASKYLQDRNYSARAWSKISGLPTPEININEMAFLNAVDWKLHISEVVFQRWTDLVLKYTSAPSPSPVSPTRTSPWPDEEERKQKWCELVKKLSPDLSEAEALADADMMMDVSDRPQPDLNAVLSFDPPTATSSPAPTPATTPAPPAPKVPVRMAPKQAPPVPSSATLPLRTLEPQLQNNNAFTALNQHLRTSISQPAPLQRASSLQTALPSPAASRRFSKDMGPTPRAMGSAMASVAQKTFAGCAQESWPAVMARRSSADTCTASGLMVTTPSAACRGSSSLARTCMLSDDTPSARPSYVSSASCGALPSSSSSTLRYGHEREELHPRNILSKISMSPTPTAAPSPRYVVPTPQGYADRSVATDYFQQQHATPCASPNSREAALSLHMLRENSSCHSSASTTPTSSYSSGSRKRSCPSTANNATTAAATIAGTGTTTMTPMLKSVRAFGSQSPSASCASPLMGGSERKRRCAERMGYQMEGLVAGLGIPQNVR